MQSTQEIPQKWRALLAFHSMVMSTDDVLLVPNGDPNTAPQPLQTLDKGGFMGDLSLEQLGPNIISLTPENHRPTWVMLGVAA